jgi:16S rRNA (guanine527-N7)-methyltransferase
VTDAATRRSIAALAERFALPAGAADQLATLTDLLARDARAPTAVHGADRIVDHHIADSLVALELEAVRNASTLLDIGSGPGVPGLPLAIALSPKARVTLLDSNARKCRFIEDTIRACRLDNAAPMAARAEAWPAGVGGFRVVTARALGPLDVVAEYAAPLLSVGGALVAWRGRRDPIIEERARTAAEILGLSVGEPVQADPFPGAESRYLHVMVKVRDTPERFPRRVGVAGKRPLGLTRI